MLKSIPATQKVFANPKFKKSKEIILSNMAGQGPLTSRICKNPYEVIQRILRDRECCGKAMGGSRISNGPEEAEEKAETELLEYLMKELDGPRTDKNHFSAFDAIMIHCLISPIGSEKRILGEKLPFVATPPAEMEQFAIAIGEGWDKTFDGRDITHLWVNNDFGNPAKPANALFSLKNTSAVSLGNMLKEIRKEKEFINELNECSSGKLSEFSVESLREIYKGIAITSAIINIQVLEATHESVDVNGGAAPSIKMIELVKEKGSNSITRMSVAISYAEKKINQILEEVYRKYSKTKAKYL